MRQNLTVTGLREAVKRVDDVGERAARPEPALRSPAVLLALQMGERRKFLTGRFKPASPEWVARKRREGLSPRSMQASGRLRAALENATPPVRRTVFNSQLTWGIPGGRGDLYYAVVQANRGRKAVVLDKPTRVVINDRVEHFLATGFTE